MKKQRFNKKLTILVMTVLFILLMAISGQATEIERAETYQQDVPKTSDIEKTKMNPQEMQKLDQLTTTIVEMLQSLAAEEKKYLKEMKDQLFIQKRCAQLRYIWIEIKKFYTLLGCGIPLECTTNVDAWCDKSQEVISAELERIRNCLSENCGGFPPQVALAIVNYSGCISGAAIGGGIADRGMEMNTDRPGNDYEKFDLRASEPELCEDICMKDEACKAWTYVKPGFQGNNPRCMLKNNVPPPKASRCCISGVK